MTQKILAPLFHWQNGLSSLHGILLARSALANKPFPPSRTKKFFHSPPALARAHPSFPDEWTRKLTSLLLLPPPLSSSMAYYSGLWSGMVGQSPKHGKRWRRGANASWRESRTFLFSGKYLEAQKRFQVWTFRPKKNLCFLDKVRLFVVQ